MVVHALAILLAVLHGRDTTTAPLDLPLAMCFVKRMRTGAHVPLIMWHNAFSAHVPQWPGALRTQLVLQNWPLHMACPLLWHAEALSQN